MSFAPKPIVHLANDSTTQTPPPGLRWNFVLQTRDTGSQIIMETARDEEKNLRFKLPQVERLRADTPDTALRNALTVPPYINLYAVDVTILQVSDPMILDLSFRAQELKKAMSQTVVSQLEIIYVHAMLTTRHPFIGSVFLQPMSAPVLMTKCQSYRKDDYQSILRQFGLL